MTDLVDKVQVCTASFEFEIKELYESKEGFFGFWADDDVLQVHFTSDEHGNVKSLIAYDVTQDGEFINKRELSDDSKLFSHIAIQIEPFLWGDNPEDYEDKNYHGMTNSDFLYGYIA